MLSNLDISAVFQTIKNFYQNHKEFINSLFSGGVGTILLSGISFIGWCCWQRRKRRIPVNTFAFDVINPQSENFRQQIYGGKYDDSLADHNILYQHRIENRNIRKELQQLLENNRWLLILGRTGIGKTREAVELAEHFNQLGWTVFYFKPGEWLDVPARMPKEFGEGRKLLFLLDDLNRRMYRSNEEKNPKAEERLLEPLNVPLQQRLLNSLQKYESFCDLEEIRIIATARNEKKSQFEGEPSSWEQLQWKNYPQLWQRFTVYELPEPSDDAIVDVLAATIPKTNIEAKPEQYLKIASSNDKTFRNVVENLRRLNNDNLPLNPKTYRPSLGRTWEKRYKEALTRYPAAEYVYDAVDLLRQFDIPIKRFIILLTATKLIIKGNIWKRLWLNFKITEAFIYLAEVERIENPRDGQIEAKGYQLEASDYARPLFNLVSRFVYKDSSRKNKFIKRLTDGYSLSHDDAIFFYEKALKVNPLDEDLWVSLADIFCNLERYKEAIASFDKALDINTLNENTWHYRGYVFFKLERYKEAVDSFDKALEINPLHEVAWYNKGFNLLSLQRYEEAIASFDKALDINPSNEKTWHNRGAALLKSESYEEAIASFDKALDINPSNNEVWGNKGSALFSLERYEDAIFSYKKALDVNPSEEYILDNLGYTLLKLERYEDANYYCDKSLEINPINDILWQNKGVVLLALERYEEAIAFFDKALEINSSDDDTWYIRGTALLNLERYEEAIISFDKSLETKTNSSKNYVCYIIGHVMFSLKRYAEDITSFDKDLDDRIWHNRGYALSKLERYEEAITSFDKALEINPSHDNAWYQKACSYALQSNIDLSLESLKKAISLNSEYREMVLDDTDLEQIRSDKRFKTLIEEK